MAHIILDNSLVKTGTKNNKILQADSGTLISCSYASFDVARSTNNGQTWTSTYTDTNAGQGLMMFEDSNHNLYVGTHKAGQQGYVIRSTDDGQNWTSVLTVDSSSTWRMAEDSSGNLYVSEYSSGGQDADELYAYHVWRSTNGGTTWAKWLSYPPQSTPGAKDSIRHIHGFFIDSSGQRYATAGDVAQFTGDYVGTMYQINANGTFGTAVGTFANGPIAFCEAADGRIYLGSDLGVSGSHHIYRYTRATNTYESALDPKTAYAGVYSSFMYDIVRGKDGVLYGQINGGENNSRGGIYASADDGTTWHLLDIQGYWGAGVHLYLNRNVAGSRLLISQASNNYRSIPDFTRAQLNSFVSGNRIRRAVDWYVR